MTRGIEPTKAGHVATSDQTIDGKRTRQYVGPFEECSALADVALASQPGAKFLSSVTLRSTTYLLIELGECDA